MSAIVNAAITVAKKALLWLTGNELVVDIVMSLVTLAKINQGAIFTVAVTLVENAWNTQGSGAEKFAAVKSGLAAEFPNVENHVLDTVTQAVYNHVADQKNPAGAA